MVRLVKRYGSRKLYDTEESRYVSHDEIARWIREGQQVRVVDNDTGEDVTAQTLTQIILEEGRRGAPFLPSEFLHELIRRGGELVESGVERLQSRVDRLLQASIERLAPVRQAREETLRLKERLEELERTLERLEQESKPRRRRTSRSRTRASQPRVRGASAASGEQGASPQEKSVPGSGTPSNQS